MDRKRKPKNKPIHIGITAPIRWNGDSRFILRWDLDWEAVEALGCNSYWAQVWALYDFKTGGLRKVNAVEKVIKGRAAAPHLRGPKDVRPLAEYRKGCCWFAHGDEVATDRVLDKNWAHANKAHLTPVLFDRIALAITSKLDEVIERDLFVRGDWGSEEWND